MAQKRGKKKKAPEVVNKHELPGGFWRQIFAVLMICIAIIMAAAWFGQGGVAVQKAHEWLIKSIGYTTYILPAILVYLAVTIFRTPGNRLNVAVWISSILMVIWASGLFGAPSHQDDILSINGGGVLGRWLNNLLMSEVSLGVAVLIYLVLIVITALFMYARTPLELFQRIGSIFKTKEDEDVENASVMRRNSNKKAEERAERGLKVNKGDAAEDDEPVAPRRGLLVRNGAEKEVKATQPEEDTALVSISNPDWKMPTLEMLDNKRVNADPGNANENARIIKDTFAQFDISVEVGTANVGPRVTQYTLTPPSGTRLSKISTLSKELALNLATEKIRIEAPIPGTRLVGVEIPNARAASVSMRELLSSKEWKKVATDKPLAFTVGKDISGKVIVGNLAKMPHLLIAGTTGSGKSVMTNTLLVSMLYNNSPADLRLIIIDPKQVEMASYNDIPHLLTPVITSVDKALSSMKWAVGEMERRYTLMAEKRVKNIGDYNELVLRGLKESSADSDDTTQSEGKMPYIVLVVDEMADLMMMAGKELEAQIVRIAQKGRAAGIHLVLATQRPEVKVVTGLIKANIPGRIAFAVNNNMDSRVMLDKGGAETLLGAGDMLYLTTEMMGQPLRVQGAYVSDGEIERVTNFLRAQHAAEYNDEVISQSVQIKGMPGIGGGDSGNMGGDLLYEAARIAVENHKLSTSLLQRRLSIGYGKAAGLIDQLEELGVVGPAMGGNKPREILISSMDEFPGAQE